jgi:hypothetical protein
MVARSIVREKPGAERRTAFPTRTQTGRRAFPLMAAELAHFAPRSGDAWPGAVLCPEDMQGCGFEIYFSGAPGFRYDSNTTTWVPDKQ